MQHILGIVGGSLSIVGTAALSYDLLKSKTEGDTLADFQRLQNDADASAQEIIVNVTNALRTLSDFVVAFLTKMPPGSQARTAESTASADDFAATMRNLVLERFEALTSRLQESTDPHHALALIKKTRAEIEARYAKELRLSRHLRIVATIGVWLVGLGAIGQLLDLILSAG